MNTTAILERPEAASPGSVTRRAASLPRHELLIDGHPVAPVAGRYFDTLDPASEQPIARIAAGEAADVDAAVRSARAAFEGPWGHLRAA
ncbi:MAG: aldehyde dehydrogenase family protein, partial [Steroidobacteraceae bacterium]